MVVLVTGSRLFFALEMIRKLGRGGHRVYAADTFRSAPGSRSRHVAASFVVPSPRYDTRGFVDAVEAVASARHVDVIVPAFEEVFYLAKHRARIERYAGVFAAPFDTLHRLHDKLRFLELARELRLSVPRTLVARDRRELMDASREIGRFFARPAFTRGGVTLYTNAGPLAGLVSLEDCDPTPQNPFLVQPFIEGTDVCTYSIAARGHIAAHSSYVHPLTIEHAGGIFFESVDEPEALAIARRIVEATRYDGQIALDLIRTDHGYAVVECNPRASAGAVVMPDAMFDAAMREVVRGRHAGRTQVAPAGIRRKLSFALLRNAVLRRGQASESLSALLDAAVPDVYANPDDLAPLVYQLVAYGRVMRYRLRRRRIHRTDVMQGYLYDLLWNGEEMAA
ncbi:MAG TPA: hypothetical protein VIL20_07175 [Sandaracinaceae bacterium]